MRPMVSHTSTKPIAKTGLRHDDPRYAEGSSEAKDSGVTKEAVVE